MPTLEWIGKKAVENHHREVPFRLLEDVPELSVGDPGSGNLLVQGDNLEALKALLPYYAKQVKCIYIDPPYNTGNEGWVYNDAVNSPEMREWLGKAVGKEAEDLSRHDKWLCMMLPRLRLLRQFLRPDGAIFVSIDDNSGSQLRLLMDEVFGRENFIATIVWQKRYSRENRAAIGDVHEYLIVFARDPELFKKSRNRVPLDEKNAKVYKNPNGDPKGRWRPIPMTAQGWRPNQMYKIVAPSGRIFEPPSGRCWSMVEEEFLLLRAKGLIWFGKNGNSQPNEIRYLSQVEGLVPWTWWPSDEVGHTDEAKKEMHAFGGKADAFDTPKPERLLRRVLEIATKPGDLVLDCFAGSGTSGAVAAKLGRRWILVESAAYAETLIPSRLRSLATPDAAFRFTRLGRSLFAPDGQVAGHVSYANLARHVFFVETGEPLPGGKPKRAPLLGVLRDTAIYMLYNGVLKDKHPGRGNVLTREVLHGLPAHDGPRVVYGTACRISPAKLRDVGVVFRQIPHQVKAD